MWVEALGDWINEYGETNRQMILEQ
jgi:hypothetical protein